MKLQHQWPLNQTVTAQENKEANFCRNCCYSIQWPNHWTTPIEGTVVNCCRDRCASSVAVRRRIKGRLRRLAANTNTNRKNRSCRYIVAFLTSLRTFCRKNVQDQTWNFCPLFFFISFNYLSFFFLSESNAFFWAKWEKNEMLNS